MSGRRIALLVEYDGTDFSGSQAQPGRRTVQGVIEDAIFAYSGQRRRVAFAGRTDAGVHARGQVVALETERDDPAETVRDALNHYLPEDLAVRSAAEAAPAFDPRRDASARCYRYRIEDGRPRAPLSRRDRWQRDRVLDDRAMAEAAALLPHGRRDWSAFAGRVPDGASCVRTLLSLVVRRAGPDAIEVTMEADAFLAHQVRRTVGALERVGAGALTPEAFAELADGPAASAGPAAPPQGLTLEAVRYAPGAVEWETVA